MVTTATNPIIAIPTINETTVRFFWNHRFFGGVDINGASFCTVLVDSGSCGYIFLPFLLLQGCLWLHHTFDRR